MRCLALAHAWQAAQSQVTFALTSGAKALLPRVRAEGARIVSLAVQPGSREDARATIQVAARENAAWIVVDGYCFGADYQEYLKQANVRLLCVDDDARLDYYCADFILNQNVHACEAMYAQRESGTRLLLGPDYALLRHEFLPWRKWERESPDVAAKVLLTFGGADPLNVTSSVWRALEQLEVDDLEIKVVVGPANPGLRALRSQLKATKRKVDLLNGPLDMPLLMAWADVAVSAAGSTVWELAFMGLPALVTILAENQKRIAGCLDKRGVAANLGWHHTFDAERWAEALSSLLVDRERRQLMSERGRHLVDGLGAERVVTVLSS